MLLKLIFTWFFSLLEIGLLDIFYFILFKKTKACLFLASVLSPGIKPSPVRWKAES